MNCIDHARGGDDRCPVLIVVKDGNVHRLAQALLDVEAFGRLDVLEIDPAERRPEIFHCIDDGALADRPATALRIEGGRALGRLKASIRGPDARHKSRRRKGAPPVMFDPAKFNASDPSQAEEKRPSKRICGRKWSKSRSGGVRSKKFSSLPPFRPS